MTKQRGFPVWSGMTEAGEDVIAVSADKFSCATAYASDREDTTTTPSGASKPREMTILSLLGSGRPMDSNVLRPMMTGQPMVVRLKNFRSSEICHRRALSFPMALLSAIATMMHFSIFNGFGSLDKLGMTVKQARDDSETSTG